MDNLSTMLPTLGSPAAAAHSGPALDMGGMGAMIPGFDVVQKLFLKFGLDPSFLGNSIVSEATVMFLPT